MDIGLISPGAMGASVGAAAVQAGNRVYWVSTGRSKATQKRAEKAGLADVGNLDTLFQQSDVLLSVCPPHDAQNIALLAMESQFKGLYVEGNAIAPDKTRDIEAQLQSAGIEMVDGGIIGGPVWHVESGTRFYLSGRKAEMIAALFQGSPLEASVVSEEIGAASALKMVFAAYTKGSTALLTALLAVAEKHGVREALEQQWGEQFTQQTHKRVTGNTAKAWRFAGEMREIAQTFGSATLSEGFHLAAADTFERLAELKDMDSTPSIEEVIRLLLSQESAD